MEQQFNQREIKKLYRSRNNRVFAGVFGGLGEYLNIDPVLLRLIYIFVTVFSGVVFGIIAYLIAAIIMPLEPVS